MTADETAETVGNDDVPTFSECVIGYRAWCADAKSRLWPLTSKRRPWGPGINTARCNCKMANSLQFDWTWYEGRRVLEHSPPHAAPEGNCDCGLYSWRRPPLTWAQDPRCASGEIVIGAVASWGRLQVHRAGLRAEHACVVTLALPTDPTDEARAALPRIARHYGVELVPLEELERVASRHGTPLPDSLRPPLRVALLTAAERPPANPLSPDPRPAPPHKTTPPPRKPRGPAWRRRPRVRHVGLILLLAFAAAFILVLVTAHPSGKCKWQLQQYDTYVCVSVSHPHH